MVVKSEKTRYSQPNAFFSGLFTRGWTWNLVQKTLLTPALITIILLLLTLLYLQATLQNEEQAQKYK